MRNILSMLATAGIQHIAVTAAKHDPLAELLAMNPDQADGECGESESEFGYYLKFVFKKGQFDKFIDKNQNDIKSKHLQSLLGESINNASKNLNMDNDFVAIVKTDENDNATADYYTTSRGHSVWKKIEDSWEDIENEEDDSYDPETDDIEEE